MIIKRCGSYLSIRKKPTPNRQGHHLEALNICTARCKQKSTLHTENASLYKLPYKQNQLNYMHQECFNAPIKMLLDAAYNNQLKDIPFINNEDNIRKYLAPSPATPKGRMKKPEADIRSTRKKLKSGGASRLGMEIADSNSETENGNTPTMPTPDIIPNYEPQTNNIFFMLHWQTKKKAHYTQTPLGSSQKYPSTASIFFCCI